MNEMSVMGEDHGRSQAGRSEHCIWGLGVQGKLGRTFVARLGVCIECSRGWGATGGVWARSGDTGVGRDKSQREGLVKSLLSKIVLNLSGPSCLTC